MATYVYLDKERTKRLDAKKYNPAIHKEKRLYCLNPKCVMKMHYVSASGNKNAYFAASPTYIDGIKMEHQGYCKVLAKGIDLTKHDPKLFSFPDCLMKLQNTHGTSKGISKPRTAPSDKEYTGKRAVRTLKEIYLMCKEFDVDDTYNIYNISDILADDRNYSIYQNEIRGYKLVETTFYRFDPTERNIYLNYPYFSTKNPFSRLCIHINDLDLFDQMTKEFNACGHYGRIIISGEWTESPELDVIAQCEFYSKEQRWVVK